MAFVLYPKENSSWGSGNVDQPDQCPARYVFLSAFSIDEKEVSRAEYDRCVQEGGCTEADYCPSYAVYENAADLPQTCVTWYQAKEYCQFLGGQLPTEAQWEKAARGTSGVSWPWGRSFHPIVGS